MKLYHLKEQEECNLLKKRRDDVPTNASSKQQK